MNEEVEEEVEKVEEEMEEVVEEEVEVKIGGGGGGGGREEEHLPLLEGLEPGLVDLRGDGVGLPGGLPTP